MGFCDELRAEAGQRDVNTGKAKNRNAFSSKKAVAAADANGAQVGFLSG